MRKNNSFLILISVAISFFAVIIYTYGATTISTSINTGGTLTVTGATTFNSVAYTWPSSDGSSGQFLTTNSSGVLSWTTASPSSGGGWTDGGVTVYPTTLSDRFLIGTTSAAGLSQLTVEATSTAAIPLTLRAISGQTANTFQIANSAGTNLLYVNSAGALFASSTLQVTGATTLYSTLNVTGLSTLGNATSSMLSVTGMTYLDGGLTMNGTAFTVANTSGNTAIGGTLNVTGLTTLGNATSTQLTVLDKTYLGDADADTLTIKAGVWSLTSTATTTVTMTNGLNFDSNTFVIDPNSGRVGVATATPSTELDVNGYIRVMYAATSTACAPIIEGAIFYNDANNLFWGCNGTAWVRLTP